MIIQVDSALAIAFWNASRNIMRSYPFKQEACFRKAVATNGQFSIYSRPKNKGVEFNLGNEVKSRCVKFYHSLEIDKDRQQASERSCRGKIKKTLAPR
jgi:hypothetical protein